MCKPHKDLARDIAMTGDASVSPLDYTAPRPTDSEYQARFCVVMAGISMYRTEQVLPALYGDSCYDPTTLVTPEAKQALADANLSVNKNCPHATQSGIKAYRDANIETLRTALDDTAAYLIASGSDMSMEAFGLAPLPTDPTDNGPVINDATVNFFTGYDDREMKKASRPLRLTETAYKPELETLHSAVAYFLAQTGVQETLKQLFENKLVEVIRRAPEDIKAGLGAQNDCYMCHHDAPAIPSM